jgi:hypothetical protein
MINIQDDSYIRHCLGEVATDLAAIVNDYHLRDWNAQFDTSLLDAFKHLLRLCWGCTLAEPLDDDRLAKVFIRRQSESKTHPGHDLS